jgi:hypothetical protein
MNDPQQPASSRIEKLIALKRFECPPPGHAELLTSKIISQLEAEQMRAQEPWFKRWTHALELNPILTTAYGGVVMALLWVGWHYGEHFEAEAPTRVIGNAGLQMSTLGIMGNLAQENDPVSSPETTLEQAFQSVQTSSSVQPLVHIPGSPVPWLRESMAVRTLSHADFQPY